MEDWAVPALGNGVCGLRRPDLREEGCAGESLVGQDAVPIKLSSRLICPLGSMAPFPIGVLLNLGITVRCFVELSSSTRWVKKSRQHEE